MKKFIVPIIAISALMFIARPPQAPNTYAEVNMEEELVLTDDVQVMNIVEMIEYFEGGLVEEVPKCKYIEESLWVRDVDLDLELQEFIWETSEKYEMSYDLVLAVLYKENRGFDLNAKNKNSNGSIDRGLMQLNNKYNYWHAELIGLSEKEFDVFNPYHNIEAGIAVLNHYRQYWIDRGVTDQERLFKYMLNSYNAGIEGYKSMGLVSRSYDREIIKYKVKLETEGGI